MAMGLARCYGALDPGRRRARCDVAEMAPGARSADSMLWLVGWIQQEPEQGARNKRAAGMLSEAPGAQQVRVEVRPAAQLVRFDVAAWPQGSGRA